MRVGNYLDSLPNCYWYKVHGDGYTEKGTLDITACIYGRFFAIELKVEPDKLSRAQESVIRRVNNAGGITIVAYDVETVKQGVEAHLGYKPA